MLKNFIIFTCLIISTPVFAQNFSADEITNINVYEKINPAIVAIDANLDDGFSAGTGCIIRPDGVILTGSHVIEDAKNIDVTTQTEKSIKQKSYQKWVKTKIWHF